ncbi:MAG: 3-methyl-2-oxobutanoate hydroxymethyltransferase [Planctomycetota bacterium]|jgi:3-methyl-2-oxobutanoate hydroxymethyltransferase|nr:3-methyl-2-oxobutanoate hydroxymethyltransferase [Planctomycetota bacterium]MDP7252389.1 3-methyl-2-oxobutanoate hydroxymethyltransferase [Planctomycetota bacterium]
MADEEITPRESQKKPKVTTLRLQEMKEAGEKISALTAYDFLTAQLLDDAGIDLILVGDSASMVFAGHDTTLPMTMHDMIYHARVVNRAVRRALVVVDMPFMSYHQGEDEALANAGRLMQDGRGEAVKLEGGKSISRVVERIVDAGIPVLGHVGLRPQSIHLYGTYKERGTNEKEAEEIFEDARIMRDSGAFGVVIEKVPASLAQRVTEHLTIPTIGIGAGPHCDGQILVTPDMLGIYTKFRPRFVRLYAELGKEMRAAFESYSKDVKELGFPTTEESY